MRKGAKSLPVFVFFFCLSAYIVFRPPLYAFDGITYFLYGSSPLVYMHPHHLLWVPLQYVLRALNDITPVPHSTGLFQVFGMVFIAWTLALFSRLLIKLGVEGWLAGSMVIFLAFSPPLWLLGSQNLPYPLFFFFTVLYLSAFSEMPSRRRNALLSIAAATLFHQMAVLFVPGGCVAIGVSGKPGSRRIARGLVWAGLTTASIGLVYAILGGISGHHTVHDFLYWGTKYMHEIHPLQLSWPDFFPKAVMGVSRSVIQLQSVEESLLRRFSMDKILRLYTISGVILGLLAVALLKIADPKRRTSVSSQPIFMVSAISVSCVSMFALLWEPANFNFWAIALFPFFICLALLLKEARNGWKIAVSLTLLFLSGWNLDHNHAVQVWESRQNLMEELQNMKAHLTSKDIIIALKREATSESNYDLLFTCLEISDQNQGRALVEDYIIPNRISGSWQQELKGDIQDVEAGGGIVYLSNELLKPESYQSGSQQSPFQPYSRPGYSDLSWPTLSKEVPLFFQPYPMERSFQVGPDVIWQLKKRKI